MDGGKRSSILKPQKPRNPLSDLDLIEPMEVDVPPVIVGRISMRRVSFASSNLIKEFATDPEKNTIWDTTYEEQLNKSDSTHNSETSSNVSEHKDKDQSQSATADVKNNSKNGSINFNEQGGEDILSDSSLCVVECTESKIIKTEIPLIISQKSSDISSVKKQTSTKCLKPELSQALQSNKENLPLYGQNLFIDASSLNENVVNNENIMSTQIFPDICSSRYLQTKTIVKEENVELTQQLSNKSNLKHKILYSNDNLESIKLPCTTNKALNKTTMKEETMEITQQLVSVNKSILKHKTLIDSDTMELTRQLSYRGDNMQVKNKTIIREETMELTQQLPGINKSGLNYKITSEDCCITVSSGRDVNKMTAPNRTILKDETMEVTQPIFDITKQSPKLMEPIHHLPYNRDNMGVKNKTILKEETMELTRPMSGVNESDLEHNIEVGGFNKLHQQINKEVREKNKTIINDESMEVTQQLPNSNKSNSMRKTLIDYDTLEFTQHIPSNNDTKEVKNKTIVLEETMDLTRQLSGIHESDLKRNAGVRVCNKTPSEYFDETRKTNKSTVKNDSMEVTQQLTDSNKSSSKHKTLIDCDTMELTRQLPYTSDGAKIKNKTIFDEETTELTRQLPGVNKNLKHSAEECLKKLNPPFSCSDDNKMKGGNETVIQDESMEVTQHLRGMNKYATFDNGSERNLIQQLSFSDDEMKGRNKTIIQDESMEITRHLSTNTTKRKNKTIIQDESMEFTQHIPDLIVIDSDTSDYNMEITKPFSVLNKSTIYIEDESEHSTDDVEFTKQGQVNSYEESSIKDNNHLQFVENENKEFSPVSIPRIRCSQRPKNVALEIKMEITNTADGCNKTNNGELDDKSASCTVPSNVQVGNCMKFTTRLFEERKTDHFTKNTMQSTILQANYLSLAKEENDERSPLVPIINLNSEILDLNEEKSENKQILSRMKQENIILQNSEITTGDDKANVGLKVFEATLNSPADTENEMEISIDDVSNIPTKESEIVQEPSSFTVKQVQNPNVSFCLQEAIRKEYKNDFNKTNIRISPTEFKEIEISNEILPPESITEKEQREELLSYNETSFISTTRRSLGILPEMSSSLTTKVHEMILEDNQVDREVVSSLNIIKSVPEIGQKSVMVDDKKVISSSELPIRNDPDLIIELVQDAEDMNDKKLSLTEKNSEQKVCHEISPLIRDFSIAQKFGVKNDINNKGASLCEIISMDKKQTDISITKSIEGENNSRYSEMEIEYEESMNVIGDNVNDQVELVEKTPATCVKHEDVDAGKQEIKCEIVTCYDKIIDAVKNTSENTDLLGQVEEKSYGDVVAKHGTETCSIEIPINKLKLAEPTDNVADNERPNILPTGDLNANKSYFSSITVTLEAEKTEEQVMKDTRNFDESNTTKTIDRTYTIRSKFDVKCNTQDVKQLSELEDDKICPPDFDSNKTIQLASVQRISQPEENIMFKGHENFKSFIPKENIEDSNIETTSSSFHSKTIDRTYTIRGKSDVHCNTQNDKQLNEAGKNDNKIIQLASIQNISHPEENIPSKGHGNFECFIPRGNMNITKENIEDSNIKTPGSSFHMNLTPFSPSFDDTQHLINYNLSRKCPKSDFSKIITGELNPSFLSSKFMCLSEFESDVFPVSLDSTRNHQVLTDNTEGDKESEEGARKRKSLEALEPEIACKKLLLDSDVEANLRANTQQMEVVENQAVNISQENLTLSDAMLSTDDSFTHISLSAQQVILNITKNATNISGINGDVTLEQPCSNEDELWQNYSKQASLHEIRLQKFIKQLSERNSEIARKTKLNQELQAEERKLISMCCKQPAFDDVELSCDSSYECSLTDQLSEERQLMLQDTDTDTTADSEKILTLREKIEQKQKRSKCLWEILSTENEECKFLTMFKTLQLTVRLNTGTEIVDNIHVCSKISDMSDPTALFVHKIFREQLATEQIRAAVGEQYDILTLLDYININMRSMIKVLKELSTLAKRYHLEMGRTFKTTFKIVDIFLGSTWCISVDLSDFEHISEDFVTAYAKYGTLKEEDIKALVKNCPKGVQFLGNFVNSIIDYKTTLKRKKNFLKMGV